MAKKKKEPKQEIIGVKAQFSCDCHNDPTCVSCHGTGFFEKIILTPELMKYMEWEIDKIVERAIQLDKHLSRDE